MATRKRNIRKLKKSILLICERETEHRYFKDFKKYENFKFQIIPELAKYSSYQSIFKKAKNNANLYKYVFCILDLDQIIKQGTVKKYEKAKKELKKEKNIIFIESIPCFEIWFLYHFEDYCKLTKKCKLVNQRLESNYIPNYKKGNSVYNILKENYEVAVKRAKRIKKINWKKRFSGFACTKVYFCLEKLINT